LFKKLLISIVAISYIYKDNFQFQCYSFDEHCATGDYYEHTFWRLQTPTSRNHQCHHLPRSTSPNPESRVLNPASCSLLIIPPPADGNRCQCISNCLISPASWNPRMCAMLLLVVCLLVFGNTSSTG